VTGNITKFDYPGAFRIYKELAEVSSTIRGCEIIRGWKDIVFRGVGLSNDEPPAETLQPANNLLERLRARVLADAQEIARQDAANSGGVVNSGEDANSGGDGDDLSAA
jgi:hypothetical protein